MYVYVYETLRKATLGGHLPPAPPDAAVGDNMYIYIYIYAYIYIYINK